METLIILAYLSGVVSSLLVWLFWPRSKPRQTGVECDEKWEMVTGATKNSKKVAPGNPLNTDCDLANNCPYLIAPCDVCSR